MQPPRFNTGLVIGKFRPYHFGHRYLITTAAQQCKSLTVVVVESPEDDFSGDHRAGWIIKDLPAVNVKVVKVLDTDDSTEISHWQWAEYTKLFLGFTPEAVFTSESYGDGWAKDLGAEHVCVDPLRVRYPVSGSEVRKSPSKFLEMLPPLVAADYIPRIVITGAESTGTTTLARELADYYNTVSVPEYGRRIQENAIIAGRKIPEDGWTDEIFRLISRGQDALEDQYAIRYSYGSPIMICDTDSLATAAWYKRYNGIGGIYKELLADGKEKAKQHKLYIVTDYKDVKFEDDGTRDKEIPHARKEMQEDLIDYVWNSRPWIVVSGTRAQRFDQAVKAIGRMLDFPNSIVYT